MSHPLASTLAYPDIKEILDQALEGNGLRAKFETRGTAIRFRQRANQFRAADRRENKASFPDPASPLHARSVYDPLIFKAPFPEGEKWVIVIEVPRAEKIELERL